LSRLAGGGVRIALVRGAKHYVAAELTDNRGHPVEHVRNDRELAEHDCEFAEHDRDQ